MDATLLGLQSSAGPTQLTRLGFLLRGYLFWGSPLMEAFLILARHIHRSKLEALLELIHKSGLGVSTSFLLHGDFAFGRISVPAFLPD
jgi:hypothetical protein